MRELTSMSSNFTSTCQSELSKVELGLCWTGDCLVRMKNRNLKLTSALAKGDVLEGGARIICVVMSRHDGRMRTNGELTVTPWHPIKATVERRWSFPEERGEFETINKTTIVYNLVLDSVHQVEIGGFHLCTLGHEMDLDKVVTHDYFGTQSVILDLKDIGGWEDGRISVTSVMRDPQTGRVFALC